MKRLTIAFILLFGMTSYAQTDTVYTQSYLNKSTSFAWFTYGGGLNIQNGGTTNYFSNGSLQELNFGPTILPRLTIGGIHFWGHVDFYVSFPLSFLKVQNTPEELKEVFLLHSVETGIRAYPVKLQTGKISPFVGMSFRAFRYFQEGNDLDTDNGVPYFGRMIHPIQGGVTYTTNNWHISLSGYYNHQNEFQHFITPNAQTNVEINPLSFDLQLLKYIDSDRGMRNPKVVRKINEDYHKLKENNLISAWYVGVGPSAALQVSKSPYLRENFGYFFDNYSAAILPDLSAGYYFSNIDMNAGLSFRTYGETYEGFSDQIKARRTSFGIETYKFLFNWLGFAPFVGPILTSENLSVNVNGTKYKDQKIAAGITFGWDIRVTKTETALLRTNLRYYPNLHMKINGEKMMFDHLEFNFIQYVMFIGRKKALRN
ncbi:MAG: hypothetical protein NXI20_26625 [bacterium]|nr:hypothetical protein [bacterium]